MMEREEKKNRDLPEGWGKYQLGDPKVADLIMGQSPSSEFYNDQNNGLPFYQGKADFGNIYPTTRKWCSAPIKKVTKNDILMSVRAPVGDVNICSENSCIGRGLAAIRSKELSYYLYLFYYLLYNKEDIMQYGTGTTFQSINRTVLDRYSVNLPPLVEQKKIAAILYKIQMAIEAQDEIIKKTQELKKSTMQFLFTRGIYGEKTKQTEIGEMPEGWGVAGIGDYCQKLTYGYTESARNEKIGPKFLRITDITENGVNWEAVPYCNCSEEKFKQYELKEDDILFARIGATTGKSYIIKNPPKAVYASYLIKLRADGVDADYLYYFFNSEVYWQQITANKANNLKGGVNASVLSSLLFPLPNKKSEQKEIANILDIIAHKIIYHDSKKTILQQLFNSMLNKLMTGKIRV